MPPEAHREIGSEFAWDPAALLGAEQGGGLPSWLPAGHRLFATGCGALTALLRSLQPQSRLHVPSYFCVGVAEALSADVTIAWYRHLPDSAGPSFETLRAEPGDMVLAQNLFGREDRGPWDTWRSAHPGVTVIEDHSHDPFSGWAQSSTAAYAVASLRKTLPVPDGGLMWSPAGLDLPRPDGPESPGAHLKLTAMLLKSAWLDGRPIAKDDFRTLYAHGEHTLLGSTAPASTLTTAMLPLLDVEGLRAAGRYNAQALAAALPPSTPGWRALTGGPVDAAPFRIQLVCPSPPVRDSLLRHLASHGIYAPVHWRQNRAGVWSGDEQAADLADRMLTVPVDHRCRRDDIHRIAGILTAFSAEPALTVSAAEPARTAFPVLDQAGLSLAARSSVAGS
ncbi:hypothetical protein [Actinoplanes friuliensis]|uniref:DegT/DnrJ/EryC1/StrS aminotransferase n=1 Tax=Actinoplanes friuliensis DSM 7358 TaxID=1246995 RepID=U5VYA2_9ACTN|nr:hypothetical protein [Actinoplanes friuliensis]AGZ40616.1 hypothetical protein AFR_11635 [Actinoplanes friuliensis DSM 7358]